MSDYPDLVRQLSDVDERAAVAVSLVHQDFHAGRDAAAAEVVRAERAVRQARATVRAARRSAETIDARSYALWDELGALLGRRGRRLGALPEPASDGSARGSAAALLDRASGTITRAGLGTRGAPVPRSGAALLPLVGAGAAVLAVLPLRGIVALSDGTAGLVAEVSLFFAPLAGAPLLAVWTRRRYRARPDATAVGLTALGGVIATCALLLLLH